MDKSQYLGTWRRRENDSIVTVTDVRDVKGELEAFAKYASGVEAWLLVEVLEKVYEKVAVQYPKEAEEPCAKPQRTP